mmetsp:Transcript_28387/g.71452  ORF Transcript_28387/g.71452 Transcript_28387/m.71452 type:complete len:143 (+) Transcript_28387:69-497(+)
MSLSICYEKGRGVEQSDANAAARYSEAFALDAAGGFFELGALVLKSSAWDADALVSFKIQLAVRNLALSGRLRHAAALEMLATILCERAVVSMCCMGCGATRALRECVKCHVAAYCDRSCKVGIWQMQKSNCKQWARGGSSQ